jgi:hypothetical protein
MDVLRCFLEGLGFRLSQWMRRTASLVLPADSSTCDEWCWAVISSAVFLLPRGLRP